MGQSSTSDPQISVRSAGNSPHQHRMGNQPGTDPRAGSSHRILFKIQTNINLFTTTIILILMDDGERAKFDKGSSQKFSLFFYLHFYEDEREGVNPI